MTIFSVKPKILVCKHRTYELTGGIISVVDDSLHNFENK